MFDAHKSEIDRRKAQQNRVEQRPEGSNQVQPPVLTRPTQVSGRGSASVRTAAIQRMQQTCGNRAVQRSLGFGPTPVQRTPADSYSANNLPMPLAGTPFGLPDFRDLLKKGHDMFGGGTGYGNEPPAEGSYEGPYAYAKENEYGGQEAGFSAYHEQTDEGVPFSSDWLYAEEKQGFFGTSGDEMRYGIVRNGGVRKTEVNEGGYISGDVEGLSAGLELSAGTDGATASIGANAVGGSVTLGEATAESNTDEIRRFGLSAGPSAALRTHWGDEDNDGYREYGLGADIGVLSMDYKTEDPAREALRGLLYSNPFTIAPAAALDYATSDVNVTDKAVEYGSAAVDAVGTGLGNALDWATDW
jgi:hypothetical protein